MKRMTWVSLLVIAAVMFVLIGCAKSATPTAPPTQPAKATAPPASPVPAAASTIWKFQGVMGPGHMNGVADKYFTDEVTKRSGGRLRIDAYLDLGLGFKTAQVLPSLSDGLMDAAEVGGGHSAGELPIMEILELPGFVPYDLNLRKQVVMALFPYWAKAMDERNIVLLGLTQIDPRNIYTKKAIATMADLKGLKIRSAGAAENLVISTLGATPATVDWGETYSALERGVIDGFGVTNTATISAKLYEQAKYAYETEWGGFTSFLAVNKKSFNALPPDLQELVRQVGKEAYLEKLWSMVDSENAKARNDLLTKGMKFIAASPEAKQSIERAGQDFWKDWAKRPGPVAEEMRQVAQKIISGK